MTNVLAQITNPALPDVVSGGNGDGGSILGKLISNLVSIILLAAFVLSLFNIITGGIQWITSGDDKNGLESARNKITHAIMGLIIVAASWAIMSLVGQFLGFGFSGTQFTLPIPSLR